MTDKTIKWAGGAGVYTATHGGRQCVAWKTGATWEARFDGGHVGDYRTLREAKAAVAAAAASRAIEDAARGAERAAREAEDPTPAPASAPAPAPAESRQVRRQIARRQAKADLSRAKLAAAKAPGGAAAIRGGAF